MEAAEGDSNPIPLKRIRLELARDHDFPSGSRKRGYEFAAPLDETDHIDKARWRENRSACRVHRFWQGEEDEVGHLILKPSGNWAFHYDIHGNEEDDETGFRFAGHAFLPGEYVSIREHDNQLRTFRVIFVRDLH